MSEFPGAEHGFDQPIGLLSDCHRRIEHFLAVCQRLIEQFAARPLDRDARINLETALNYFHSASPRHIADEEQSLFPRMRQSADARVQRALAQIDRLESDHRDAERAHARLEQIGRRWLADGTITGAPREEFSKVLADLTRSYGEHIRLEDEQVFTLASEALDSEAIARIGDEMKRRRENDPGRPGSRCAKRRTNKAGQEKQPS
jgi:hemerythrin-like domain-containing protein